MNSSDYCICCLSKSNLQHLHEEILEGRWPWEQPTVAGMMFQCFNIMIERDTASNTICSQCVTKVRDALSFREQVISTIRVVDSSQAMLTMQDEARIPLATSDLVDTIDCTKTNNDSDDPLEDKFVAKDNTEMHIAFDQTENVKVQVCPRDKGVENPNHMVVFIAGLSKDEATRAIYNNTFEDAGVARENRIAKRTEMYNARKLRILEKVCVKYESDCIATYKCLFCKIVLQTMDELVKHVSGEHKCLYTISDLMKKAGIKYVSKNRIIPYKLGENDVVCKICNEEFPHTIGLNKHMNEHYPYFLCGQCGKSFATRQRLRYHEKRHNPEEATCGECGLKFRNKESLYSHGVRKHRKDRKWHPCPECSERFNTYNQRVRHLAEVHGRTEKRYKCTMCPKAFLSYILLYSHKLKHTRRYDCEECGRKFYKKPYLLAHQNKAHGMGEPVFVCEICNKSFSAHYSLSVHKRLHARKQIVPEDVV